MQVLNELPAQQVHQHEGLEWTAGVGLDPASPEYKAYLKEFGDTYLRVVGDSIEQAGELRRRQALDPIASEVLAHTQVTPHYDLMFTPISYM